MARKAKAKATDKKAAGDSRLAGDECVIAPVIPPDEAGKYGVKRDVEAEGDIADYVRSQSAPEDDVKHVELVTTEFVMGRPYEVWDVTTAQDRWWVITNPTNLYSQKTFTSLDYTLSFHVGLMLRVQSRHSGAQGEQSPFDAIMRRHQQASDLLDAAVEAQDFQAVGMSLRECLIALVGLVRQRVELPADAEAPQAANFKGWADLLLNHLCRGPGYQDLRSYMKNLSKESWELVNWLTHTSRAEATAAGIALEGVATLIGSMLTLVVQARPNVTATCPRCASRNIRTHFDIAIGGEGDYFSSCGECGWDSHPVGDKRRKRSPRGKPGTRKAASQT